MDVSDWQSKSYFQSLVKEPGAHLIVFAARWCGFCSRFLEQARSLKTSGKVKLVLIDADNPDESLWDEYSVKIVPTIFVFYNGQIIFRRDGKSMAGLSMSELQEAVSKAESAA
jgi:thioredoxin-like negative regulator of GroEL